MKRDRNDDRYDQDSELYVGPSSRPFVISEAAKSPYLTREPAQLDFSHSLSQSSLSTLASRCSVKPIQDEIRRVSEDAKVTEALRKRLLVWAESDEKEALNDYRKRKKTKNGHSKDQVDDALVEINKVVPEVFRITTQSRLSAYYQREGLLEQSCIKRAVPTKLLQTPKSSASSQIANGNIDNDASEENEDASSPALVLSISVYARPVRGMWAKERVQQLAGRGAASMEDLESETSSIGSKETEDAKSRKGERSLYGPLQLMQKIEVLSTSDLQQLRESFFCRMDDLPEQSPGEGPMPQYSGKRRCTDSCFLFEDVLYSETADDDRYAASLEKSISARASNAKMKEVQLNSLSICTGKLYWFLHQGSCEHLWCITSTRKLDASEAQESFPLTTHLASAAAVHPIAKWTQSKNGGVRIAYTLDKCEMCKGNQANMLLVGGSRIRLQDPTIISDIQQDQSITAISDIQQNQSSTIISGLKQDVTCICNACWTALRGNKPNSAAELVQEAGDGVVSHPSSNYAPTGTGSRWSLVPTFE